MQNRLKHFILSRFNLLLWNKDKEGRPVRTKEWLEHRFALFEKYCLPSIIGQTCKEFEWIVLFDSKTPESYKSKIEGYQRECPQFHPVYVDQKEGRFFPQLFRNEVVKRLNEDNEGFVRVLTTYLDNDDALNVHFVEDLQQRAELLADGTFISYSEGYQFYTDYNYVMQIHYPRNHFISVVESGSSAAIKTVYGFGSHYYIEKIPGVSIYYVNDYPIWCEIIHEKNMGNDAYFLLRAVMAQDGELLSREFNLDETVNAGVKLYIFKFIPRYVKTFIRRTKNYLFGRQW